MNEEVWAEVEGFPDYAVSNHGRVMSIRFDRILSSRPNSYGHARVVLYRDRQAHEFYVDALVKEVFEGRTTPPRFRRLMVLESGMIFKTIQECADHIGGHASSIYRVLRGERESHLGYTFKYVEEA